MATVRDVGSEQGGVRSAAYAPPSAIRTISSVLKPAWLAIGAMLLRRFTYMTAQKAPRVPVVITASHPWMK